MAGRLKNRANRVFHSRRCHPVAKTGACSGSADKVGERGSGRRGLPNRERKAATALADWRQRGRRAGPGYVTSPPAKQWDTAAESGNTIVVSTASCAPCRARNDLDMAVVRTSKCHIQVAHKCLTNTGSLLPANTSPPFEWASPIPQNTRPSAGCSCSVIA